MSAFDRWVDRGPFTARDLGIYRIIFAALSLALMPRPELMSDLPRFLWAPPPGPFRLLYGPPPYAILLSISILEAAALAFLLFGLFTRTASIAAGITYITADGLTNSYGTIYHYILLGVVPLALGFAGWGRRYSLDAARRGVRADDQIPQWPLRLLALCIGVAFATAGVAKIRGGWLNNSNQAALGNFYNSFLGQHKSALLAPVAARVHDPALWEVLDWTTVALELAVLFAVVSWASFCRVLLVVIVFHVSVLLVLNIAFAANVVAYGAFVRWSLWLRVEPRLHASMPRPRVAAAGIIGAAAVGLMFTGALTPRTELYVRAMFVVGAAAVAAILCIRPRRPMPSSA